MKSKIWAGSLLTALAATAVMTFSARAEQENISNNLIRIHVIANSDSKTDQRIKLDVRDMLISEYAPLFETLDKEIAAEKIKNNVETIEKSVNDKLSREKTGYAADVSYSKEYFPEREYEEVSLPAGRYDTVKVVLGEGKGKNWWCIMFPPLCSPNASDREAAVSILKNELTDDEYRLITEDGKVTYSVKFKILEILANLFK